MSDIVERLNKLLNAYPLASMDWPLTEMREAADTITRLRTENFALAANQCHAGYAGEHGDHMCRDVDKLRADLAAARAKERERCAKAADKYHDALMRARHAAMEAGQQDAASILESRGLTALGIAGTIRTLTDEEQ